MASLVPSLTDATAADLASVDLTLYCEACGAVRRLPTSGPLFVERMDDMDPALIALRAGSRS
jgi:hypothetical protein